MISAPMTRDQLDDLIATLRVALAAAPEPDAVFELDLSGPVAVVTSDTGSLTFEVQRSLGRKPPH
ncbi:hypothetical protein [Pararhodobacter zhoushanensis]|uniref:hypothetical protein n=1 Tax=Pararhodobacter zhoushanensis TaxID=2479545 RepID=UPI000F8CC985|nr:hypothetical protein [Pararhodobacter zhoushanensis]